MQIKYGIKNKCYTYNLPVIGNTWQVIRYKNCESFKYLVRADTEEILGFQKCYKGEPKNQLPEFHANKSSELF